MSALSTKSEHPAFTLFFGQYGSQLTEGVRNQVVMAAATSLSQRRAIGLPNRLLYAFAYAAGKVHLYAYFFTDSVGTENPPVP